MAFIYVGQEKLFFTFFSEKFSLEKKQTKQSYTTCFTENYPLTVLLVFSYFNSAPYKRQPIICTSENIEP